MATKLIPYDQWIKHTESIGARRSSELKALDEALREYEKLGTDASLKKVRAALTAWKTSQGPGDAWKKSRRNKDGYIELLTTLIEKGGDTDSAWGTVPDFMHENLINARLGVIYLFSRMAASPHVFNVLLEGGMGIAGGVVSYMGSGSGSGSSAAGTLGNYGGIAVVPGKEVLDAGWAATKPMVLSPDARTRMATLAERVKLWFEEFAKKVIENFKAKWNCELPAATLKAAVLAICNATLTAAAAGVVSGAIDTAVGTLVTVDAAITKIKAWKASKDVEFASGHPRMVVDTINRAMWASLGEGMWSMLKGVGNIAMTAASAGASLIVSLLIAGGEMLAKLIWRLYETFKMRIFFGEAAEHWRARHSADALHRQPFAFARWYRKHVLLAPALAVLTLNSGICGDKMIYLSMFKDDQTPISSAEFRAGTEFLDSLKVWGVKYLDSTGSSFSSTDDMVSRLIQFAKGGGTVIDQQGNPSEVITAHQANLTGGAKAWDWVMRAATA